MAVKKAIWGKLEYVILAVPLIMVAGFLAWGQLAGDNLSEVMGTAFSALTHDLGWLYLLFGSAVIIASLWLAFGPYAHVKLGPDEAKPEFSNFAWYAMLFACGNGVGIVYWGAAEPLSFLMTPPLHLTPGSTEAAELSLAWAFFHWGWTPWAFYLTLTLPLGYFAYRRSRRLCYSSALPDSWRLAKGGIFGKIIDGLLIFSLCMGIITSMGLGIKQMAAGLNLRFGVAESASTLIILGIIWTGATITSNVLGIRRGMSTLSNWNIYTAFALMLFVFITGPSHFILDMVTNTIGTVIQNFPTMSFWTDPIQKGGFPQNWTTFYWSWWIAWSPILAIFVSRISRGRTFREIVLGHLIFAVAGSWLWFGIFGSTALNMALFTDPAITELITSQNTQGVIYRLFDSLPGTHFTSVIFMVVVFLFLTTTCDSSAFICAQMSIKGMRNNNNPPIPLRAFWAILMGGVSIYLVLYSEGITALQIASLVPSIFVLCFFVIAFWSFVKSLNKYERRDSAAAASVDWRISPPDQSEKI